MAAEDYHTQEEYEMSDRSFPEDVDALVAAMAVVLQDINKHGVSTLDDRVAAQARIAYEPFAADAERAAMMPLEDARRILAEVWE